MTPPALERLCLSCRSSVARVCPVDPAHPILSPAFEADYDRLCAAAWEARGLQLGDSARWGGALGGAVGAVAGVVSLQAPNMILVGLALGGVVGTALVLGGSMLAAKLRGPQPAGSYAPSALTARDLAGRVTGEHAVAWQIEYTLHDRAAVTLRHGWCRAFELLLDDGRKLCVDAGLARLDATLARWRRLDDERARAWLQAILPRRAPSELEQRLGVPTDPVPFHEAHLLELTAGDRVAVASDVQEEPVDGPGAYRGAAARVVRFAALPALRLE